MFLLSCKDKFTNEDACENLKEHKKDFIELEKYFNSITSTVLNNKDNIKILFYSEKKKFMFKHIQVHTG